MPLPSLPPSTLYPTPKDLPPPLVSLPPSPPTSSKTFISTPTSTQNLRKLFTSTLGTTSPVLLLGPSGSGKSALLTQLSSTSKTPLLPLYLDDTMDSKTLLGSYVCTDTPGEFKWQDGALTTAVRQGTWVVIEDIDLCPFEILAAILPLFERRLLPDGEVRTLDVWYNTSRTHPNPFRSAHPPPSSPAIHPSVYSVQ